MSSPRSCPACEAAWPGDSVTCASCGCVVCWDCGAPNLADEAFCRRCGVWIVGRESGAAADRPFIRPTTGIVTTLPVARSVPDAASPPRQVISNPLRVAHVRTRRGRWAALVLVAAVAVASVASATTLVLRDPGTGSPTLAAGGARQGERTQATSPAPLELEAALTLVDPTVVPVTDATTSVGAAPATGPDVAGGVPAIVQRTRPATLDAPAGSPATARSATARSRNGWVCDDASRITDAGGRRWIVDRVSFRAMGGYERLILHLDEDGPASLTATALAAPMASSSVRGSDRSATRSAIRRGIGIDLSGGIRSGLELRSFRPQGLRAIRELSIHKSGPGARVLVTVASGGCYRLRAPAWQAGGSGSTSSPELIIDVRR